jgi:hypothetical protein
MAKKNAKKVAVKTVMRKIFFFQIVDRFTGIPLKNSEVLQVWNDINTVANHKVDYFHEIADDEYCLAWMHEHKKFPLKLQFGKTRQSGLPQIEGLKAIRPIALKPEEGINDLCHMVVFDKAIVGFEFNFHGPRISRLADFINQKTSHKVKFVSLLNKEAAERLADLEGISLFDLKIKSEYLTELTDKKNDIVEVLNDMQEKTEGYEIQIIIKSNTQENENLGSKVMSSLKNLISKADPEKIDRLKVKGYSTSLEKIDEIDLLSEALVSQQGILQLNPKFRTLSVEGAFRAIEHAYKELAEDIEFATRK